MEMPKRFDSFYTPVTEKDEHKKSKLYKKLSPKMRDAVDDIFAKMDSKPQDFLNKSKTKTSLPDPMASDNKLMESVVAITNFEL